MGIIAKQSVWGSIYSYAGAIIGFISTGLLMPIFFQTEQVGLINILIAISIMFSQVGGLGFVGVITLLFPNFRNKEEKHNGILTLGFIFSLIGFVIVFIAFLILKPYLVQSNFEKSALLEKNIFYVPILIFFTIFYTLFDNYNKVLYDTISGTFLKELFTRLLNLIAIVLFVLKNYNFNQFLFWYIISNILPTIVIFILIVIRKNLLLGRINIEYWRKYKKDIFKIAAVWVIAGFSGLAIMNIDKYMVNYYLGLKAAGIYSVTFFFGVLIVMPSRALRKITSIVIADAWKKNDLKTIDIVYYKSTINQLIVALFLMAGIWINIDNIFRIIPDYNSGRLVVIIIALANVVDMAAGISPSIISNTKYYKMGAYIMLITIVLVIILNIFLIPLFALNGAAVASLISIFISYFIRYIYIYNKFGFQPYSKQHLKVILITFIAFVSVYFILKFDNLYLDIFIRSSVLSIVFALLIFFSNTSEDLNRFVYKNFLNKFKAKR